jgi:hypothetical protein
MSELKPCPFCGGKATINFDAQLEPFGIWCPGCHMLVKFTKVKPVGKNEKFGRCMDDIAEAWNRRATDESN